MMYKHILILFTILLCGLSSYATEPYEGSRIFWDVNTKKTVFESGNYARMIQLQDGRLMAVTGKDGICISFSTDKGKNWSSPQVIAANPDGIVQSVPDLYQLKDGTILVGYNPRPSEPYSKERKFGIRVKRSINNGSSWSDEIFIYDAQHTFEDGCWEPAFLELPSGEVQCYFANENSYTSSNEQDITMLRSFDKGLSWTDPTIVSFREGNRDGMPVPLLLKDQDEIVVIIEDNGYAGYEPRFQPATVRNTLNTNWENGYVSYISPLRDYAIETALDKSWNAGAPYIRQLSSGETILSYQGTEGRDSKDVADMFVLVGNNEARNFKAKSRPFNTASDKKAKWNSVSVIEDDVVVAIASTNASSSSNQIQMIKGYAIDTVFAAFGTKEIDGIKSSDEKWVSPVAEQLVMGYQTKSRWTVDFSYDNENLYLFARVIDSYTKASGSTIDGIRLLIDADNACTTAPQEGAFNVFFNINGDIKLMEGDNGHWTEYASSQAKSSIKLSENRYYIIEASIPWSDLGKSSPEISNRMAIAVERYDFNASSYTIATIPDASRDAPYTWMTFVLQEGEDIATLEKKGNEDFKCYRIGNILKIESNLRPQMVEIYSLNGEILFSEQTSSYELTIPPYKNYGIARIIFANNQVRTTLITPYNM